MINTNKLENFIFLIQKDLDDSNILHSFGFEIINAIRYERWYNSNLNLGYELVDQIEIDTNPFLSSEKTLYIPIGSVEFVESYLKASNKIIPKPLNIPPYLRKIRYIRRIIEDITLDQLDKKYDDYYIKSGDRYKQFDVIKGKHYKFFNSEIKVENLFVSSEIKPEIDSEFRSFVTDHKLISVRVYSSNESYCVHKKHVELLNEIIEINKKENPLLRTYTIDYAVLNDGSFELIEMHHPYSVGNYGFNGINLLHFYLRGYLSLYNGLLM
jgi:hypothetical protein